MHEKVKLWKAFPNYTDTFFLCLLNCLKFQGIAVDSKKHSGTHCIQTHHGCPDFTGLYLCNCGASRQWLHQKQRNTRTSVTCPHQLLHARSLLSHFLPRVCTKKYFTNFVEYYSCNSQDSLGHNFLCVMFWWNCFQRFWIHSKISFQWLLKFI